MNSPNIVNDPARVQRGEIVNRPRFRHTVRHLHGLGVRPLAEFLAEMIVDPTQGIREKLEGYALIDPSSLRELGGHEFPPAVFLVPTCIMRRIGAGLADRKEIVAASLMPVERNGGAA